MHFLRTLAWVLAAVVVIVGGPYLTARWYLARELNRAKTLLDEVAAVKIGDDEASIAPLMTRYGGRKQVREGSATGESVYTFVVDPWHFPDPFQRGRDETTWSLARDFRPRLRRAIGLRRWLAAAEVWVNSGKVVSTSGTLTHEGWSEWTMGEWRLVKEPTPEDEPGEPLRIFSCDVTFDDAAGKGLKLRLTPAATAEQIQLARELNWTCLTRSDGCRGSCDLMPRAVDYAKRHFEPDPGLNCERQAKSERW